MAAYALVEESSSYARPERQFLMVTEFFEKKMCLRKNIIPDIKEAGGSHEWESQFFDVRENQYYKVCFDIKTSVSGLWGVHFYCDEIKLNHDFFDSFSSSPLRFMPYVSYFNTKHGTNRAKLIFRPSLKSEFIIKNITVEEVGGKEVLKWMRNNYALIPEVNAFKCEKQYLSKTINRFVTGGNLRIVLLGDSIVNDIANSNFELLLRTFYPSINVEIIPSVKDSTGCEYYQREKRVQEYIVDYSPDLLVIGGISNRGNVNPIRRVITRVRKKIYPEILITNEIFGKEQTWNKFDLSGDKNEKSARSYDFQLRELAEQEKVEFFDIKSRWIEYMKSSNKKYEFFLRDRIHPNRFGRLVIAYFMFYFFVD